MSSWFLKSSPPGRVMARAPKTLIGVRTRLSKFPDVSLGKMEASNDVTDWESASLEEMTWPPKNNKESVSHVSFLFTQRHWHDKDYRQRKYKKERNKDWSHLVLVEKSCNTNTYYRTFETNYKRNIVYIPACSKTASSRTATTMSTTPMMAADECLVWWCL